MTNEAVLKPVMRFIDEVLNEGKGELIPEIWAEDMVWEGGSMGTVHGRDAWMANSGVGSFSNMHLTVLETNVKDNEVWVRFTNEGTQTGDFMGHPATNKFAKWNGFAMYTVADGKITRGWFSEDLMAMMMQLGIIETS